jgi:hypothetical protein
MAQRTCKTTWERVDWQLTIVYRAAVGGVPDHRQKLQISSAFVSLHFDSILGQFRSLFQQVEMFLFIWLIICTFQLVFSAGIVFFSHNKLANSVFQPAYQRSRTGP